MRAYNVGSEREVTIKNLALEVASCINKDADVVVHGIDNSENVNRYVPSVDRAMNELGISQIVSLAQAISRTRTWLKEMENINER